MSMNITARAQYLVEYLVKFLGPKAANYTDIVGHDFGQDDYIGGGFQANMPPGLWTAYGEKLFNDPADDQRILFAGTEWSEVEHHRECQRVSQRAAVVSLCLTCL